MSDRKPRRCHRCRRMFAPPQGQVLQRMCPRCTVVKTCRCSRPIPWHDELGERCIRCAGWLDLPEPEQLKLMGP